MVDYRETIDLLERARAQIQGSVWHSTVTWHAVSAALDLCVRMRAIQAERARLDLLLENSRLRERLVEATAELKRAKAKSRMCSSLLSKF